MQKSKTDEPVRSVVAETLIALLNSGKQTFSESEFTDILNKVEKEINTQ